MSKTQNKSQELDNILHPTYANIYYIGKISTIGGVETFLFELAKKYSNKDITFFYTDAPVTQLERLKKYGRVEEYKNQKIKCKKAFFNYQLDPIDNIEAEEYIEIVHGDFSKSKLSPHTHPKINKYYGVSQHVCESFTKLTGKPCLLCYNPIQIDPPKKILKLVSATRFSYEKGGNRMKIFADALTKAGIPFIWIIFTNRPYQISNPNIVFLPPRLEGIRDYLANADYVVQLSDTEGYCYTVLESLALGTPVIVTPVPSFIEQGVNENNGFILDFSMSNIPLQEIYTKHFNFSYTPKKDIWYQILSSSESSLKKEEQYLYKVQATSLYEDKKIKDKELARIPQKNESWYVTADRLRVLMGKNIYNETFVKYKGKIKKERQGVLNNDKN